MKNDTLFEQFRSRLARIGIVKALIPALIFGFAANFLLAFVTWFLDLGLVLVLVISLGALILVTAVLTSIFYVKFFRPTTKTIAKAIDRLGLEERIITMHELENDESYIAMRQREDAKEKLAGVNANQFRYNVARKLIVTLCIVCVLGLAMTTVSSLAAARIIWSRGDLLETLFPPEHDPGVDENGNPIPLFTVTYIATEHGSIFGQATQSVRRGEDASPVSAIPEEGFQFASWSDGLMTADRWDWEILEDMTLEAYFTPEQPPQQGNNTTDGEHNDDAENENPRPSTTGSKEDDTVNDGNTHYKDEFNYDDSVKEAWNDDSLSDELKDIIKSYFESLNS